jgi:hypothetical protein
MFPNAHYASPSCKDCKMLLVIYCIRDIWLSWKWWTYVLQTHDMTLEDRHKYFITGGRITIWKLQTFSLFLLFIFTKYPFLLFNSTQFLFLFYITHPCTRSLSHTKNIDSRFLQKSVTTYRITWCNVPHDHDLNCDCSWDLRSEVFFFDKGVNTSELLLLLFPLPTHTTQTIREISDDLRYFVCP